MKKILSLTLILTLGLTFAAKAELVWKTGYILLNTGDSVKGDIRVNTAKELPLFQKVAVKIGEVTKTYKPEQVKEYAFESSKFVSRKVDGEMQFLKVIVEGQINLYELQFELQRGDAIVVDKDYYIEKQGNTAEPEKIKESKFKKIVADLMADDAAIVAKVQADTKKYEINDMQSVVEEYNSWYSTTNGSFTGSR
ncbi:MAG TPA: hypothetical protein VL651_11475 [Bacteroidia bacterium]|jgi:hypothetical protein|nr:hypothetical protein [Bacteroidia bacterium]